jgi:phage-related protein
MFYSCLRDRKPFIISPIQNRYRKSKCSEVSEPKYWAAEQYRLTAQFSSDPFLYDVAPVSLTLTDETVSLYNDGEETRPTIEMAAGSTVTINGSAFEAALQLTVDGESYIVYDGTTNRYASLTGDLDDFVLPKG